MRIHQLQRDLVNFAETCFTYVSTHCRALTSEDEEQDWNNERDDERYRDDNSSGSLPVKHTLKSLAAQRKTLTSLQHTAYELLLHLSCMSPIAPLAVDSPYRSSMTGLDLLILEVCVATEHSVDLI